MPFSLYLLALAVFAMGTSEFMLAGLVSDIAASVGVSVGAAGLLTSAFAAGMVIGAPVMAAWARRWPARASLLACVLVFALSHVVSAVTSSFPILLCARVIAAVANAGFLAVALSAATMLVAPNEKGRALAVLLGGTTAAIVAGVPGGALLGSMWGWRATFWAVALLCIPAAVGIIRSIPARLPDNAVAPVPSLRAELAQLASPQLVLVMTLGAMVNGGTFAAFTFFAPIVTDTAGMGGMWVPMALVLFGVGSFVGVALAGRLADRHPERVVAVGGPLLVLGWLGLGVWASHPGVLLTLTFTQGLLAFSVGSTLIARVLHAAAGAPSMGGSYATAALNAGAACGPALAAISLSTGMGNLGPVWIAAALTGLAVLIVLPVVKVIFR